MPPTPTRATGSQWYVGGKVFTGQSETDFASAFRVTDGTIDWVGSADQAHGEPAIDLQGRTVLPGLLDVHVHPGLLARQVGTIDLLPPRVSSLEQLLATLAEHPLARNGSADPGGWIVGNGYDDAGFPQPTPPTARDLDQVSSTVPILVTRCDGHSASCNSKALQLAGIDAETPNPPGAVFERDEHGNPTGVLTEIAAMDAVLRVMPAIDDEQLVDRLAGLSEHFLSRGLTAIADPFASVIDRPLEVFRRAAERGFGPRCALYFATDPADLADLTDADRTGRIRVGGLKVFMDGAFSNRTAWVSEPYPDSAEHGLRLASDEQVLAAVEWARRNRVQVAIHAMGDAALHRVVDLVGGQQPWLADSPSIRLEHTTLVSAELLARLTAAPITFGVATHTIFYFAEHASYARNLTPQAADIAYPIRDLWDAVPALALSSDCPATAWSDADNPFVSMGAAVARVAHNGADIGQRSAITIEQAVLLYTSRASAVTHLGPVGKIAVGCEANFVVLDRDVFTVSTEEIAQVRPALTYVAGRLGYQR